MYIEIAVSTSLGEVMTWKMVELKRKMWREEEKWDPRWVHASYVYNEMGERERERESIQTPNPTHLKPNPPPPLLLQNLKHLWD